MTTSSPPPVENGLRVVLAVHQFVTQSLGGVEIHTYHLARELQKQGHQVRVVFPEYSNSSRQGVVREGLYDNMPISTIAVPSRGDLTRQFKNEAVAEVFSRYVQHLRADLVHFQHLIGLSASCITACAARGIPTVMTAHDAWMVCQQAHLIRPDGTFCDKGPETVDKCLNCLLKRMPGPVLSRERSEYRRQLAFRGQYLKNCLKALDGFLVCSRFLHDVFDQHGFSNHDAIVSPLGVPPKKPLPRTDGRTRLRLVFLGAIYATKGLDILLRAFNQLDDEKVELHVYGQIVDRGYFQKAMEGIGMNSPVTYHGSYAPGDLPSILATADVAVVPSRCESYSFVIRECLRGGVPVVASNVGAIPEAVVHGKSGLLFEPGDHEELAMVIRRLVHHPELVEQLRNHIGPVHTVANEVRKITCVYRDISKRSVKSQSAATPEDKDIFCNVAPERDERHLDTPDPGKLLEMGEKAYGSGRVREAEAIFRKMIRDYPHHCVAHNDLACLLWETGRRREGVELFRKAMHIDPNNRDVSWNVDQLGLEAVRTPSH